MRKSMSTGALSFVIAVWWGTSRYLSLRSTFTSLLMTGKIRTIPGPFEPVSLPSLNWTTRSYSRTILMEDAKSARKMIRRMTMKNISTYNVTSLAWRMTEPRKPGSILDLRLFDYQSEPLNVLDLH